MATPGLASTIAALFHPSLQLHTPSKPLVSLEDCGKVGFMLDIRYTFDLFLSVNFYVIAEYSWIMLYLVQITFKNIKSKLIIIIFDIVIVLSIWKEKILTTISGTSI